MYFIFLVCTLGFELQTHLPATTCTEYVDRVFNKRHDVKKAQDLSPSMFFPKLSFFEVRNFEIYKNNPPAPACQGHQGCGVRFNCLFNNSRCYSSIRLCSYVFRGSKCRVDYPRQISNSGSFTSPKNPEFPNLFARPKKSENGPQGFKQTTRIDAKIYNKTLSVKKRFL